MILVCFLVLSFLTNCGLWVVVLILVGFLDIFDQLRVVVLILVCFLVLSFLPTVGGLVLVLVGFLSLSFLTNCGWLF